LLTVVVDRDDDAIAGRAGVHVVKPFVFVVDGRVK
jgi:hypothetical protein